jgi:hypothetical protein
MTMTMKSTLGVIGVGLLVLSVGCTERAGIAPTELASNTTVGGAETASADSEPTVTLRADLTADPASITVPAWDTVLFVNNSGRFVTIHSYNCSEFSLLRIPDTYSRRSDYFRPAGKKCNYFVWDDNNYSRQILVGEVIVQ